MPARAHSKNKSRAKSRVKSRMKSRKSRPTGRAKSARLRNSRSLKRRRPARKVKVSPASYNQKKCMATPGWEWVRGKGCRKVRAESKSPSSSPSSESSESSDSDSDADRSPPVPPKPAPKPAKSKGKAKASSGQHKPEVTQSPSRFNKEKCLATPGWTWTPGGCRKIRNYNLPCASPANTNTVDAAAALQEAAEKSK